MLVCVVLISSLMVVGVGVAHVLVVVCSHVVGCVNIIVVNKYMVTLVHALCV